MNSRQPAATLLKNIAASVLGWGAFALAISASFGAGEDWSWSDAVASSLTAWLPWAIFTPAILFLVFQLPIDREHWRCATPVHLAFCLAVVSICHSWSAATLGSRFSEAIMDRQPWSVDGHNIFRQRPPETEATPRQTLAFESFQPLVQTVAFHAQTSYPIGSQAPTPPNEDNSVPLVDENGGGNASGSTDPSPRLQNGKLTPNQTQYALFSQNLGCQFSIYLVIVSAAHAAFFSRRKEDAATGIASGHWSEIRQPFEPHFVLNTFGAIRNIVHRDPNRAEAMLGSLGDLLRLGMEASTRHELPLSQEAEFVQRYLELMQAQFEGRISFDIDISPDTEAALVPPLLLQALVQNAIERNLLPKPGGGTVQILARRDGILLSLSVADNGVGGVRNKGDSGTHYLGDARKLLSSIYGKEAVLHSHHGEVTLVEVTLPFRTCIRG